MKENQNKMDIAKMKKDNSFIIDHAQRIRDDLNYILEIRKECFNDKKVRINGFLKEIKCKVDKALTTER